MRDLVIIGGGPAGYVGAIRAAQLGGAVTLIEKDKIGGVCLNVGCIPTKTLLSTAKIYNYLKKLNQFGLKADNFTYDFDAIQKRKEKVINRFVKGVEYLLKKNKVEIINGTAEILDKYTVLVNGKKRIETKSILIATGSQPARLDIGGFEHTIDSTDALELGSPPSSMLIIGGGVIGVEMGLIFNSFETDITIVELTDELLPGEDREICTLLHRILEKKGFKIYTSSTVKEIIKEENIKSNIMTAGEVRQLETDVVLSSVGRNPIIPAGIEECNIETERGFIKVNEKMQTNIEGIYAAGDVCGKYMFAYTASMEGEVAVTNALGGNEGMSYDAVPRLVYSFPEIGTVGLTEEKAKETYDISVGRFPFLANSRAYAEGEMDGLVKVIIDNKNKKILGIHILGPSATEIILASTLIINKSLNTDDVISTLHGHPTYHEAIKEACLDALGRPVHK